MKKTLLILPLLLLLSCYDADRNCTDFKTGKFKFEHEVDGVMKTTIFERNDTIEIETFEGKTELHPKNMAEEKAIGMKILTTSKNSYTFEFGMIGVDEKQRGTVTKISE